MQERYQDYKPFLRLDFSYRCAYCTVHEGRHGGQHNFQVEHFRPKGKGLFPELELVYTNLYYACNRCNVIKGRKWPSPDQESRGLRFVDPCEESFCRHVRDQGDGVFAALTPAGQYTIDQIRLNRSPLVWERRRRREALLEVRDVARTIRRLRTELRNKPNPQLTLAIEKLQRLVEKEVEAFWRPPVPPD